MLDVVRLARTTIPTQEDMELDSVESNDIDESDEELETSSES